MKIRYIIGLAFLLFWGTMAGASDEEYYASLKKKEVNWRTGPGERYPILWVYQEQGYPVKVLDTYDIWRQVEEADGTIGWVHKKMLSDKRTVLVRTEGVLLKKPEKESKTIAVVETGTIGKIDRCPAGSAYCQIIFTYQGKEIKGWFPRQSVWGLDAGEEID